MVKEVLKYYKDIALSQKKYSIPPLFLSPIARIGTDYIAPLFATAVINKISSGQKPPLKNLFWYLVGFFGVPLISEVVWRYIIWSVNRAEVYGMQKIGEETFADIMSRPYDFHVNNFAGALVAKINRFVSAFEPLYDRLIFDILGNLVGVIFAEVVLFRISWVVGSLFLVVIILYCIIITKLTRVRHNLNKQRAQAESLQTAQLADAFTNAITTKIFARERIENKLFAKISQSATAKRLASWDYQNERVDGVTVTTVIFMNTFALLGSIYAIYRFGAPIGTVFLMLTYMNRVTNKFWDFSRIMRDLESNIANAVEMMTILKEKRSVEDAENVKKLAVRSGVVELQDINFTYESGSEQLLFNNLNLMIPASQQVGLVGPSGGGKTTITKLLLRFMDTQSGSIMIDGQDTKFVTQRSLRDAITYVPQEPLLFHRSLAENISYGKPGATMEEIVEAAKKAYAHEFISKLPNGYDTLVGERGIKLSGGQRQRVAIARAILKDAPIIVLDEATSALDSESEKLIQKALFELMEGRTAIVIAHRLSTIKHLDRIIVLDDGQIKEDGTHDELSAKKDGTYARLWAHQSGGFIE